MNEPNERNGNADDEVLRHRTQLIYAVFSPSGMHHGRGRKAGVTCILTGSEAEENELVHSFVQTHHAYGVCGIHPHAADDATERDVARIKEILTTNDKIVAVGETGLDYDRMYSKKEHQLHFSRNSSKWQKKCKTHVPAPARRRRRFHPVFYRP